LKAKGFVDYLLTLPSKINSPSRLFAVFKRSRASSSGPSTIGIEELLEACIIYFRANKVEECSRVYTQILDLGVEATARLSPELRSSMANYLSGGGLDNEVRVASCVLGEKNIDSDINDTFLEAWLNSSELEKELAYFKGYPAHSLLSNESRAFIYHVVRSMRPNVVAEIGTYKVGTAEVIARALWENGQGTLHTTDPFGAERCPAIIARLPNNLQQYIRFYALGSMDFFLELENRKERIDIAFVDGNHDYEFAYFDLMMAARNLHSGGIIIMDNIEQAGPLFAALEFLRNNPFWQVLGRKRLLEGELGNPFRNITDRSSLVGTSLLILKAPSMTAVFSGAFSTGQVVLRGCKAITDVVFDNEQSEALASQGTLFWQTIWREFPDGSLPIEHFSDGEVRIGEKMGEIRISYDPPLKLQHLNCHNTFEINLCFSTLSKTPFCFRKAEIIADDGQTCCVYK